MGRRALLVVAVGLLASCRYDLGRVWPEGGSAPDVASRDLEPRDSPGDDPDATPIDTLPPDLPCSATCGGCCEKGQCVTLDKQGNTQCGQGGVPCSPCLSTSPCQTAECSQGVCITKNKPVGETCKAIVLPYNQGRCASDGTCCIGCLDSSDNCVKDSLFNKQACGEEGEPCKKCRGALCVDGTCQ